MTEPRIDPAIAEELLAGMRPFTPRDPLKYEGRDGAVPGPPRVIKNGPPEYASIMLCFLAGITVAIALIVLLLVREVHPLSAAAEPQKFPPPGSPDSPFNVPLGPLQPNPAQPGIPPKPPTNP